MTSGKAKLDMKHGFMKSIIRNQVDRDNYDREIKSKVPVQGKGRHKQSRNKKPEVKTYVPPFSRQKPTDTTPETSQREMKVEREELFLLEYEDRYGHIHKRKIYKSDNPDDVAYRIGQERHLSPPYIDALAQRLTEEMEKRHDSSNSSDM